MTEEARKELEQRLAERLGDPAWEPAATCPQGHISTIAVEHPDYDDHEAWIHDPDWQPGSICLDCVIDADLVNNHLMLESYLVYNMARRIRDEHQPDPFWHPEWRIGRQLKPLTTSLDALMLLVEAWCKTSGYIWLIKYFDEEDYLATIWPRGQVYGRSAIADTAAEALALALDAALAQEGGAE